MNIKLLIANRIKFKKIRKRAQMSDSKACEELGFLYEKGIGVFKNTTKSLYWYEIAAMKGRHGAQRRTGMILIESGLVKEGMTWLKSSAKQGNILAKKELSSRRVYNYN